MKPINVKHNGDEAVLAAWQSQLAEAQEKPWLASLLLQQGERILRRFMYFYDQLRSLPRKMRRTFQKRLATTLAGAALLLALSSTPSVHAATITVTPGASGLADDGQCSLVEAITNANNNSQLYATAGECIAGSGADIITLAGNTYGYAPASVSGPDWSPLPAISSPITIDGNNAAIERTGGATFRILYVAGSGDLTLNNVTVRAGSLAYSYGAGIYNDGGTVTINNSTISGNSTQNGNGGGIVNRGTMTLNNSTVSGNSAGGDGGGIYNYSGTLTLNNSTISGNSAGAGGGILTYFGSVTFNRSLVSGNSATNYNEVDNVGATMAANNYNLFGDSSQTNAQAFSGFTPSGTDRTATSDGTNPTAIGGILNTTLAQNGVQPHTFTHALVSGGPAIDVIPDDGVNCDGEANTGTSRDQRGGVRANTTYGSGAYCDIGAYEYGSTTPTAVTIDGLGVQEGGSAGLAVSGAAGILALLSGGILSRRSRRRTRDAV